MCPLAKVNQEVRQPIITVHSTNEPFQNKVCKVFGEHGPLTHTLYILLCVISWGGGGGGGTHYNELHAD